MAKYSNRNDTERPQILVRIPREKLGRLNKTWNWKGMRVGKKKRIERNLQYESRLVLKLSKINVTDSSASEDDSSGSSGEEDEQIVPGKITHYKKDLIRKHSSATLQWTSPMSAGCENKIAVAHQETCNPAGNDKNVICNEKENTVNISDNISTGIPEQTNLDMIDVGKPKIRVLENTMLSGPSPQFPHPTFNIRNPMIPNEKNTSNEQDKSPIGKHVLPPVMLPQQQSSRIAVPLNDHSAGIQRQNSNTAHVANKKMNYPNVVIQTEHQNDKNVENGEFPMRPIKRKQTFPIKRPSTVVDLCNSANATENIPEVVKRRRGRPPLKKRNEMNGLVGGVANACPGNEQGVSKANGEILAHLLGSEKKRYPEVPHGVCPDQRPVMAPALIQQTILMNNKEMEWNYDQNHMAPYNYPLPYHGIPRYPPAPPPPPPLHIREQFTEGPRPTSFPRNEQAGDNVRTHVFRAPPSFYNQHRVLEDNAVQYPVRNVHGQPAHRAFFRKPTYEKDPYLQPLARYPFNSTARNVDLVNPGKKFEIHRPDRVYSQRSGELYRHLLDNSLRAAKERTQPLANSLSAPVSVIRSNDLENYNPDLRYIPPASNVEPELQLVEKSRDNQELFASKMLDNRVVPPLPAANSNKTSEEKGRLYFQCLPEQLADIIVDKINEKTSKAKDDKNKTNETQSSVKLNVIKENPAASILLNQKGSTYKIENLLNTQITRDKKETSSNQINQDRAKLVDEVRKDPIENSLERPESQTVKVDVKNASTSPLPYNDLIAGEDGKIGKSTDCIPLNLTEGLNRKILDKSSPKSNPKKLDIFETHEANGLENKNDKEDNKKNLDVETPNTSVRNEAKNTNSAPKESDTISLCDSSNSNDEVVVIKKEPLDEEVQDFDPNEPIQNVYAKIMSNCFKVLNLINEMQNTNTSDGRRIDAARSLSKIKQGLRGMSIFLRRSRKLIEELDTSTADSFAFMVNCLGSFRNRAKKIVETDYALKENYISTSEVVIYQDVFVMIYEFMSGVRFNEHLKMRRNLPDMWRDVKKEDDTSPSPDEDRSSTHLKHMLEEFKQRRIAEEERNEILNKNISHRDFDEESTILKNQSDEDQEKFDVSFDVKENLEAYRELLNQSRGLRCQDNFKTFKYSLLDSLKRKGNVIQIDSDSDEDMATDSKQKKKQKVNDTIIHIDDEDENETVRSQIENVNVDLINLNKWPIIEITEDNDIKMEIKCEEEESTAKTPEIPTQQIDFEDSAKENEDSPSIASGVPEGKPLDGLQKVMDMKEFRNLENCETIDDIKRFLKETEVEIRNRIEEVQPERNVLESEKKNSNYNTGNKLIGIATPNVKEPDPIKSTNQQITPVSTSENLSCDEAKQESEINHLDGNGKDIAKTPENNTPSETITLNQIPQENLLEKQMNSNDSEEVVSTGNEHEHTGSKCREEAMPTGDEHEQMVPNDREEAMPTENDPQNKSNVLTSEENMFDTFWKNDPATDQNSKIMATVFCDEIAKRLRDDESPNFPIIKNTIDEHILNAEFRTPSPMRKQEGKKILFTTREYSNLKANHLESGKVQNDSVQWKPDKLTSMDDSIGLLSRFSKQELMWDHKNPTFTKPMMSKSTVNTVITTPIETDEKLQQSNVQESPEDLRQTATKTNQVVNLQAQAVLMPIPSLQLIYNDSINTKGFISQYIKDEIATLSKKESLSPCEYVQEVTTLLQLPLIPKDFKDFYIFVTKQQILQFHQPITFYIFLELLNQSGLKDYHKKFTEYTKRKYEDGLKVFKDQQLRKKT